MQLEIERQAFGQRKDKASKERLGKIEKDLADLRESVHRAAYALGNRKNKPFPRYGRLMSKFARPRSRSKQAERLPDSGQSRPAALWHPA